jgi:hypothetical protein
VPHLGLWRFFMTGVPPQPGEPTALRPILGPAVPNPVRGGMSTIPFALAERSRVRIRIFDLAGRRVRDLLDEVVEPGDRSVSWNGLDDRGVSVPAVVYLYELETGTFKTARKLIRIR